MREVSRYAENAGCRSEEVLPLVRQTIDEEQIHWGKAGRPDGFPAPEVLLAFLRDAASARNGAANGGRSAQAGAQEHPDWRMLRDLREQVEADAASLRRESVEQFSHEPAGSLPALSHFLARCCEAGTSDASGADAATLPLISKVAGRVGLLRGSGNAIVPQAAAEFVRAFMDIDL